MPSDGVSRLQLAVWALLCLMVLYSGVETAGTGTGLGTLIAACCISLLIRADAAEWLEHAWQALVGDDGN